MLAAPKSLKVCPSLLSSLNTWGINLTQCRLVKNQQHYSEINNIIVIEMNK